MVPMTVQRVIPPNPVTMPSSSISIQTLGPDDYYPIAALEAHAFDDDPITIYALGTDRASPAALQVRAHSLANPSSYPPARIRKAVTTSGQIAGFALWKFYTELTENPVANGQDQLESRATMGTENGEESEENKWPEGANFQLCEAVFEMSDELCRLAMWGKKYAVLNNLAVSPDYQGRGIGSMLIREGLEVVDEMGLSAWLGATEVALPLYKKVGFEVDRLFEFDMTPYGGEGLTRHTLMIRPPMGKEDC